MHCLFREHLQCAVGNLGLFIRIVLAAVILSLVGNDDLHVSFRAEGSTLEQRNLVLHASLVHVLSGFDVIKRVGHDFPAAEELIGEDFLSLLAYFVESGDDVALETRIELQ